jgi:L-ascorbate metabolism protein UlaG (beta-lactamase superfamily)
MWLIYVKRVVTTLIAIVALISLVAVLLWQDRPSLDAIDWPKPATASAMNPDAVTVTWLGVTTLLFDDSETQILIDGFFSRPTLTELLLDLPVDNNAVQINYAMNEFRMRRLAAIIPVHSHFDHAMDVGEIANRSSASVIGTQSTAEVARGAGVPEDQITVIEDDSSIEFGNFKVTLRPTGHAPIGWRGSVPFDGLIEEPLTMPQPVSAWRMGGAVTIIIEHPQGTALIQGSASYKKYELEDVAADVVFLGVGQLGSLGRNYAELYWQHTITATGSHSVYPIHFDDLTQPFGEVVLPPRIADNFEKTAEWLGQFRNRWDKDASLFMPEFGKPIAIFSQPASEP